MQHGDLKLFIMTHQHTEARSLSPKKMRNPHETLKTHVTPLHVLRDTRVPRKVARRAWVPRTVLEFAIKTRYVLVSWKASCYPWIFSCVLKILEYF